MTVALAPRAARTRAVSVTGLIVGALTSTAMWRTRPSARPRAESMIASTPAIGSSADTPIVSLVATPASAGYVLPGTSLAARAAPVVVIRSPAAKSVHTAVSAAVSGGVHGRSAAAGAASTVSGAPLTVIRAPSTASTARTPLSRRSRARSDGETPPGTEAMTSPTISRVVTPVRLTASAARPKAAPTGETGPDGMIPEDNMVPGETALDDTGAALPGAPLSAATVAATAAQIATSPPPMAAGRARRVMVSSLTVSQLYKTRRRSSRARPK